MAPTTDCPAGQVRPACLGHDQRALARSRVLQSHSQRLGWATSLRTWPCVDSALRYVMEEAIQTPRRESSASGVSSFGAAAPLTGGNLLAVNYRNPSRVNGNYLFSTRSDLAETSHLRLGSSGRIVVCHLGCFWRVDDGLSPDWSPQ